MSDPVDEWADAATGWDEDEYTRAYAAAAFESLRAIPSVVLDGSRVLDFGCGTGLLTESLVALAGDVVAVDTSTAMLDVLARKVRGRGWSNVAVASDLDTVTGSFDLVVCSSVCAFVDDYLGTVQQLVSLLRPGGVFVQWDWELDPDDADGHGLARSDVEETLRAAGLHDLVVATAFSVDVGGATMEPLVGHGRRPA